MTTANFTIKEHVLESQYIREYPRALAHNQEDTLKLHIKQYTPKQPPRRSRVITIIGAHANAFPKELYEPLWDELYNRCTARGFEIGSVWIADVAHQGMSSVLNEELLGDDPSWFDHSRDLLHMINTFREEMPRPIVGIGHSMGGAQLTNLALFHPRLFASLVLLDPVISLGDNMGSGDSSMPKFGVGWASSYRRDIWPSGGDAIKQFGKSPFYQKWDKRVLDLWIRYGLRDLPTALHPEKPESDPVPVTLTTPKTQEVWMFLRPNYHGSGSNGRPHNRVTHPDVDSSSAFSDPFYRPEPRSLFLRLPHLRPPTFYIMGETSNLGSGEVQRAKVPVTGVGVGGSGGVKEGNVDHIMLKGIGHLVPMEATTETADAAVKWLGKALGQWFDTEQTFRQSWGSTSMQEKTNLSKEWYKHIGPPPGKKKPQNKL